MDLPKDMFQLLVCPQVQSTRRWYTVPVSALLHLTFLAVVIVVPLVATDVLPAPKSMLAFIHASIDFGADRASVATTWHRGHYGEEREVKQDRDRNRVPPTCRLNLWTHQELKHVFGHVDPLQQRAVYD